MDRIIATQHLVCLPINGIVLARQTISLPWCGLLKGQVLGRIDNMPYGLSIELMDEWSDIADLVFEEFIASTE